MELLNSFDKTKLDLENPSPSGFNRLDTITDFNPNMEITSDFNWILRVCANAQFYNKMKNHEFIDIWNQLNTLVRYNILK